MITKYSIDDFDAMRFNPLCKQELEKEYPELMPITKLCGKDADLIMRYILLVYDETSVLAQSQRDITMRKQKGIELSGIKNKSAEFIESITLCTHKSIVKMICEYMKVFKKPRLWQMIVANEMLFQEYNERLMQKIKENDMDEKKELDALQVKTKIRQEVEAINTSLESYYSAMFGKDEDLKRKIQDIDYSPEGQALKIK